MEHRTMRIPVSSRGIGGDVAAASAVNKRGGALGVFGAAASSSRSARARWLRVSTIVTSQPLDLTAYSGLLIGTTVPGSVVPGNINRVERLYCREIPQCTVIYRQYILVYTRSIC